MKQVILAIGDLHTPYLHPDAVAFLSAVKAKHKPTEIVFMGDEIDWHSISFHEHDQDLMSAGDELKAAIKQLQPLYKMFPKATVLESNHGSLVYRKALTVGLPSAVLKGYREILQAPQGWNWKFDHLTPTPLGDIYWHHGKSSSHKKLSQNMGLSAVQGHFHNEFYISYWSSPKALYWDANVGCLVDHKSRSQAYGKNNLQKPIVGCMVIHDGVPTLIPMILNSSGRWIKRL
jgi:hypothetical protein